LTFAMARLGETIKNMTKRRVRREAKKELKSIFNMVISLKLNV
jgi:hypothetical protein